MHNGCLLAWRSLRLMYFNARLAEDDPKASME